MLWGVDGWVPVCAVCYDDLGDADASLYKYVMMSWVVLMPVYVVCYDEYGVTSASVYGVLWGVVGLVTKCEVHYDKLSGGSDMWV